MKQQGEERFPYLFQKGSVGRLETLNRVKYAACCVSNYNNRDGSVTERELARIKVIANTGCGIITNQGAYPDPRGEGKCYYTQLAIYDDRFMPQFEKIADMIRQNGAIGIQQLLHAGRYGGVDIGYCVQPSDVPQTLPHFRPPRAVTKEDIKRIIGEHVDAAKRAIRCGFHGVEITSFMGYLLANFCSKFTNRRTDEYGGSSRNRARFMTEMITAVKEGIGDDHPLLVRLPGNERMDRYGGNTEEECLEMMVFAAEAGVDMISVTVGWQESPDTIFARDVPPGHWNYLAARAKKLIPNVPIAFGVRLPDPVVANKCIAEGQFDFWEVCRPMLADPEMIHKIRENRLDDIRPCIGCVLCLARLFRDIPYVCTVNAQLGHEVEPEYHVRPAARRKKIMVIGGGPAGMEYAVTAKQRGHDVELFEAGDRLGGQLAIHADGDLASKEDLMRLTAYYERRLRQLEIPVHLETRVTADMVNGFKHAFDVAVVATGAKTAADKSIPGSERVVTVEDVLSGSVECGQKVVVLGGGQVSLCVAEYLASKGRDVSMIEERVRIGYDASPTWKWRHTSWIEELNIQTYTRARVKAIGEAHITIIDKKGNEVVLPADTVVAGNRKSQQSLVEELEFLVDEVHVIGDAVLPRSLHNAIHEGYRLGTRV